ncbi:S8 family peptidase [Henriciella aquimarina]|uniref:S8 family peptidase n=1 Tax=Henriciella aquimarina TaxID=545261 RepID=UPI000A0687C8|nr:S8 family peptidase [Henriciella aquimarina]
MTLRKRLASTVVALGLCAGLSACDRTDERLDRLGDLGRGVVDQLTGSGGGAAGPTPLEAAPVEARAFAGEMQDPSPVRAASSSPQKFVVGSIVAKPRNLPPPTTQAEAFYSPTISDYENYVASDESDAVLVVPSEDELQALESELGSDRIARAAPRLQQSLKGRRTIAIDPKSRELSTRESTVPREALQDTRTLQSKKLDTAPRAAPSAPSRSGATRDGEEAAPEPVAPAPEQMVVAPEPLPLKSAERRLVMRQDAMAAQMTAESRMIDTAQRYGLAANIQRSRSGQMVIEIGSRAMKPTRFDGEEPYGAWIAEEDENLTCPDNPTEEQLQNDPQLATVCVIQDLKASGEFEYVEKDWVYQHQMIRRPKGDGPVAGASLTPNDPLWALQWNFLGQGSGEGKAPGGAGFIDFWTAQHTQGSEEVVVAVVDTGLEMAHPDIKDSPNVAPGWDMVTDVDMANDGDSRDPDANDPGDKCPDEFVYEDTFHGTHVAGTIGASVTNNAAGVAGGAWNVKIVPVRALGKCGGRLSDINDAIRWAGGLIPEYDELGNEIWNDNPADVINLSIGLFRFCPASMQDAIDAVVERGVVVVAAAGNDKVSTQYYAPGGCNNVVAVAAGDARGMMAPYSNYGAEVDLMAPGGDLSRDDNGDGRPDGILSTKTAHDCIDPVTNEAIGDCFYAYEQGTSMAAPHVSAALALVKSKRPELSGQSLTDVLLGALTPRTQEQCSGPCVQYPGAELVPGSDDMCKRPCGSGLLNLSDIKLDD